MKSIVLIELEYHNEVLRAYLLTLLETSNQICCLTTQFNYDQLIDFHNNGQVRFEIKQAKESHAHFFESKLDLINGAKAVLVITLPNNDAYFKTYKWPSNSAIVIHNYHSVFCPATHTKGIFNYLSLSLASKILGRVSLKHMAHQFNAFVVPSETVYAYVKQSFHHQNLKLLGVCDFLVNESESLSKDNTSVKIALPGRISQVLRDYNLLYGALDFIKADLNKPIELNFLGTAKKQKGEKILNRFKNLEGDKISVLTNNQFVSQEAYDQQMRKADFLVLPLLPKVVKQRHVKEKLGYSSVSGNIGDIVKYATPTILPAFYPLEKEVDAIAARYTDIESLGAIILDWVNNCRYNDIRKHTGALVQKYAPDQRVNKFLKTLDRLES